MNFKHICKRIPALKSTFLVFRSKSGSKTVEQRVKERQQKMVLEVIPRKTMKMENLISLNMMKKMIT